MTPLSGFMPEWYIGKRGAMEIPVIDLAAAASGALSASANNNNVGLSGTKNERDVAEQLLEAFTTIGFATLTGHGVDFDVMDQAFQASYWFFALPTETKLQYKFQGYKSNRGYIPFGLETHDADGTRMPDRKETFDIGPERPTDNFNTPWPNELEDASFREPLLKYFESMDSLHLRILKLLGMALKLEDPNYFVDRCNQQHENLRLLHYPSIPITTEEQENDKNQSQQYSQEPIIRGSLHTDFGTITLLCQDSVGGLRAQRRDGSWTFVPPVPHSIVVNVGDMLQRWTNDVLRATPHQVVEVRNDSNHAIRRIIPERFSIAFFCNANKDTILDCLPECTSTEQPARYPPVNAYDYLTMRLTQTISAEATVL